MSSVAFAPHARELVFGRYRPLRPLGSGGSGSVWLARDERTGLDVALKIIPREGKAAARAEREALAARRLRHDRCVRAYDVGHDASHVYIAYEYVPGRTLREALRADSLSDGEIVEVAAQVLDALAHAHRTGIVHRDVKPSNILLEDADEPAARLLDFGLAQFDGADTLTAVGDVPGTLAYIAPERLAGDEPTPGSDVWSAGVLLWEALGGRHPFWGVPLQDVARAIEAGAPPLAVERSDLPRRLLAAVDAALDPELEARPRASELASTLRGSLRGSSAKGRNARSASGPTPARSPAAELAVRLVPVALAVVAAALGSTLLPFWPPVLVAAIVAGAGLGAWLDPRLGAAVALAAPVFPLGNHAEAAAVLYGLFAVAWLALCWSDARRCLSFVLGPVLAPLGLLALLPLVLQPVRGLVRRAAQGALAVGAAVLTAGVAGADLPLTGEPAGRLDIGPADSVSDAAVAVHEFLAASPILLAGAGAAALAAAGLPRARRLGRFGVAAVGAAVLLAAAFAAPGIAAMLAATLVWALAAAFAAGIGR